MISVTTSPLGTLNIIGCGRLGKALARLWHDQGVLKIAGIHNTTLHSAQLACEFIGSGTACETLAQLPPADAYLISATDHEIKTVAKQLKALNNLSSQAVIFHCSGSLSSEILSPLQDRSRFLASVHPVHSFADPLRSQDSFAGSYCAMQGEKTALNRLEPIFSKIGGHTFNLDSKQKPLYHAATAVASNYLVTLLDMAIAMLEESGLTRQQAQQLLTPIATQTVANACASDTTRALTGPIARGDVTTVCNHLHALAQYNDKWLGLYKNLGQATLPIAKNLGQATDQSLSTLEELLCKQNSEY